VVVLYASRHEIVSVTNARPVSGRSSQEIRRYTSTP
jgi:hypothetical protein